MSREKLTLQRGLLRLSRLEEESKLFKMSLGFKSNHGYGCSDMQCTWLCAFEVVASEAQQCLSLQVNLVLETLRLSFCGIKVLIGKQAEK